MRVLSWDEVARLNAILAAELGTHEEQGPNHGTCEKYQAVTGNGPGDSWCLSFLMWGVLQVVGSRQALKDVFGVITGSCEELRKVAYVRGQIATDSPQMGDVGLVVNTEARHAHHAFYVKDGPSEDGSYETLEGNSNNTGGSNGDGVYRREKRFGIADATGANHYELVRLVAQQHPLAAAA